MQARASTESPSPKHLNPYGRFRRLAGVLLVSLLLVAAGLYGWRYLYRPCEVQDVEEATEALVIQSKIYDRVYQSAVDGDRTSLDYPVTVMQQTFMDTQAVVVPACLRTAKSELLGYMGTVIAAFRAYGAAQADQTVRELVRQSNLHYDSFLSELDAARGCAPFCFR